ncbi:MAG: ATP-binding protein [Burkholderiales bacterium]
MRLRLTLLGGFAARLGAETPVVLASKKAQGLLAYLALRPGQAHAREKLIALLWGDSPAEQARHSLSQTLFALRHALARCPSCLQTEGKAIALDAGVTDVDVVRFEQRVGEGAPAALEEAAALYSGDLLEGLDVREESFETWLQAERSRLRDRAVEALARLLAIQTKQDALAEAAQTAVRLLALDPLQEEVHRTLIGVYARQGRRGAALRQYQTCVTVFQRELGVDPDAATKRLYQEILQHPPSSPAGAAAMPAPSGHPVAKADSPFVGRQAELAQWDALLRDIGDGRGRALFVTGEAGIGKSRLVEALAAAAARTGARVLAGRAYETEQILPFRPWIESLRAAVGLADVEAVWRRQPHWRTELARVFPELMKRGSPPPITFESSLRLFEAMDGLVGHVASRQPLLLVFEDVHWADEMSLRLLSFVARRLAARPVAIVATARDEELVDVPVLRQLLAELSSESHVAHVRLGPLSADATTALVHALASAGSSTARVARLVRKVLAVSEGNPFVVVETMRALASAPTGSAAPELPRRVRDMIIARLERLTPPSRQLAEVAAVIEREFSFALLQQAARFTRRETAEGVEELVRRRVLDAVGERFDFTHVRIRNAIYDAVLVPRRLALHAATGEALESVYAGRLDEAYDRLAYHFSRADEPARAFTYLVHLADKAARSYALPEAVRGLHDALRYADRLPAETRERQRLDVVYRLAYVLGLLGRSAEARELLLKQEPTVTSLRSPALGGPYHFWMAYSCGNLGESERAREHARRALEEATSCEDTLTMGQASFALARESYVSGRAQEGIAHGRQSIALLEGQNEPWWLGQALFVLAWNLLHVGEFVAALQAVDRLHELGEAMGEMRLQASSAWMTGRIRTIMGEGREAIAAGRRGVALAADPVARASATVWLGAAYLENGNPKDAIRYLQDAIDQMERLRGSGGYRSRQMDGLLSALLSEAYLTKGEVKQAAALAASAHTAAVAGGFAVAVGYAERAAALVALAREERSESEAQVRRAIETFASVDARCQVARSRLLLAEVLAGRGARSEAHAELHTARDAFRTMQADRLVERAERLAAALGVRLDAP